MNDQNLAMIQIGKRKNEYIKAIRLHLIQQIIIYFIFESGTSSQYSYTSIYLLFEWMNFRLSYHYSLYMIIYIYTNVCLPHSWQVIKEFKTETFIQCKSMYSCRHSLIHSNSQWNPFKNSFNIYFFFINIQNNDLIDVTMSQ